MTGSKKIIGITDYVEPPFDIELEAFGPGYELVSLGWECGADSMANAAQAKTLHGLLVWHAAINQNVIANLENCKIVTRYGVGCDNLDIPALQAKGIKVCNTPDYGTEEVADTAAAMILALHRKVIHHDFKARFITEGWQEHVIRPLKRSNAVTLGVIGVGRIGTALINRMKSFGMRIIGYDPYQITGHEKAIGYERVSDLGALVEQSDIISINCVLTGETRHMVDEAFIARMKPGSILVNTARGALIKDLGLIAKAIAENKIYAAGLDVLPEEPPSASHALDQWKKYAPELAGRLVINPHTGYYSDQSWKDMRYLAAETVRLFFERGVARNEVAPPK